MSKLGIHMLNPGPGNLLTSHWPSVTCLPKKKMSGLSKYIVRNQGRQWLGKLIGVISS